RRARRLGGLVPWLPGDRRLAGLLLLPRIPPALSRGEGRPHGARSREMVRECAADDLLCPPCLPRLGQALEPSEAPLHSEARPAGLGRYLPGAVRGQVLRHRGLPPAQRASAPRRATRPAAGVRGQGGLGTTLRIPRSPGPGRQALPPRE